MRPSAWDWLTPMRCGRTLDSIVLGEGLVSGARRGATTLRPGQPNPAPALIIMISPVPQFFLRIPCPGSAQIGAGLNS